VTQENLRTPFFDFVGVGGATALILSDIYRVLMNVGDPDEEDGFKHSPTNMAFLFAVLVTIGAPVYAIKTERIDSLRDDWTQRDHLQMSHSVAVPTLVDAVDLYVAFFIPDRP
jgi:hypothetical protein